MKRHDQSVHKKVKYSLSMQSKATTQSSLTAPIKETHEKNFEIFDSKFVTSDKTGYYREPSRRMRQWRRLSTTLSGISRRI